MLLRANRQINLPSKCIMEGDLDRAVRRLESRNTAPGPDEVLGRALVIGLSVLGDKRRQIFTECFGLGIFALGWEKGRLVLLKKEGRKDCGFPILHLRSGRYAC